MTTYVKKIHKDKETKLNIILAAKNSNGPGHHLIELTGMTAKIEKTKKDGKLHYNLLKVYK
jgi:hypothetical protein